MNEDNNSEKHEKLIENIIDTIYRAKKSKTSDKFNEIMIPLYYEIQTAQLPITQKFSLMFYSFYNHLIPKSKNKDIQKLIDLSNFMINNIQFQNILPYLENEINKCVQKEFENYKIFKKEKKYRDDNEIFFSMCLLSKNIKLMKKFFSECLNEKLFEENDYDLIDLENPNASKLFDSLFNGIYNAIKNEQRSNIPKIIKECLDDTNMSLNKLFRCNKCYDFMIMKFDKNAKFKVKCINCAKKFKEYKKDEYKTIFKCIECEENIILYNKNYKCTRCKNILCSKCLNKHCNKCFNLRFIKLYDVGYKCEIHNSKYIYYCFICQRNLCRFCKEIHPHIIKEILNIESKVKDLFDNLKLIKDITSIETELIQYRLCFSFLNNIKNNLFNGFFYEILCDILKIDLKKEKEDILFPKFNDNKFNNYYSKLLKAVSDGNLYALNCLNSIKSYYKKNNIIEYQINYQMINRYEYNIRNFIEQCHFIWLKLTNIHKDFNYDDKINNLNLSINNLKIENTEIKTKLLIKNRSNKIYENNTHNILFRFLADELLQLIITTYSQKLSKIPLNLSIFIDLINQSDSAINILQNNEIINTIFDIIGNVNLILQELKKTSEKKVQNNLKEKLIQNLKSFNKIIFVEDINIGEETFKKEELNQLLDILFFIKSRGNIIAHPNIDLDESLKMVNLPPMPIKFEIDYFYENFLKGKIENEYNKKSENINDNNLPLLMNDDEDNYYTLNNFNIKIKEKNNLFKNIKDYKDGVMDDINNKIKVIRDNIITQLNICKIKDNVETKDIIEALFEGKDNKILNELKDFQRVIIDDTDTIIKKYLNMNLEQKLSEEKNNFNQLLIILEKIHSILVNYINFNIPKHQNLQIYINNIIENTKNDYLMLDIEIRELEQKILNELDIILDCDNTEIVVEAYFLSLIKTYENEVKKLNYIKKNYETRIIKEIIIEEIEQKLKEILKLFEEKMDENSEELTKIINDKYFSNPNNLTYDRLKYIMLKILDKNISLGESIKTKLNIDSKLFNLQNSEIH